MRICTRCKAEMVEDYHLSVQGKLYGVRVTKSNPKKILRKSEEIKVAVCPMCGELSLYIESIQ